MFEIAGIGASILDTIMTLDTFPEEDTKVCADEVMIQCGGPAATGLTAAARLGAKAAYLGVLADDGGGRRMIEEFREFGVDTEYIKLEKGAASPSAVVLTAKDKASRTIIWNRGTVRSPGSADIPAEALEGVRLLHLDGHHAEAAVWAADIVRGQGGKVLLDAGSVYRGMEEVVARADILIASEAFASAYTGTHSPEEGMNALWERYHPEVLVVTLGARGGIYWKDGRICAYPAYSPPEGVKDTTGAGDVFHGAFAFASLRGWDVDRCVRFSSAVSALKCTKTGGRSGIPRLEEVERFLAE